ncbi:MAG: YggS family pyridoxal phosphate-dependent enzyme [Pseudomonadota bacterium]|jgi:pyridoxal phosphate enzyme (YggS family)
MTDIAHRCAVIAQSVAEAAKRAGREPSQITVVAVSKRKPVNDMLLYAAAAQAQGMQVVFGENYVQELKLKYPEVRELGSIHLIGPLQTNKIKEAVRCADVIESAHSPRVIEGIAKEARALGKRQSIFIQVNIGDDPLKSGFHADQLTEACQAVRMHKDSLALSGLMTITPYYSDPEGARKDFRAMSDLRSRLQASPAIEIFENRTIYLSMGMSSDFEIAIEEGADLVRVGTALFGERQ